MNCRGEILGLEEVEWLVLMREWKVRPCSSAVGKGEGLGNAARYLLEGRGNLTRTGFPPVSAGFAKELVLDSVHNGI